MYILADNMEQVGAEEMDVVAPPEYDAAVNELPDANKSSKIMKRASFAPDVSVAGENSLDISSTNAEVRQKR